MTIPAIAFQQEYEVRTYDVDNRKIMTVPALVMLMQEAAMQNAIQLHFSIWDFEAYDFNWVLMRKQLQINRLPKMRESIKVVSYPAGFYRFFAYRDYFVFDLEGNILASSASTWLLMNLTDRKVVPIPEFILSIEKDCPAINDCLPRPKGRLKSFDQVQHTQNFKVNWHDLDFNEHLNNVHYMKWMIEALPKAVLETHVLKSLDIHYKLECHLEDELQAQVYIPENGIYKHRLINLADGNEVARADTVWSHGQLIE
jgi:medium-chain acyl-[acyl-carrier-protein] hydrolase